MSYTDYSSHWQLDTFLTYLEANVLGSNDEHLYDTFAVEHNINTSTVDGTHKTNSITGSSINTTPASTGSQAIAGSSSWTPTTGVYQMSGGQFTTELVLQLFISGVWRGTYVLDSTPQVSPCSIMFFDGTNMKLQNTSNSNAMTIWYQKF